MWSERDDHRLIIPHNRLPSLAVSHPENTRCVRQKLPTNHPMLSQRQLFTDQCALLVEGTEVRRADDCVSVSSTNLCTTCGLTNVDVCPERNTPGRGLPRVVTSQKEGAPLLERPCDWLFRSNGLIRYRLFARAWSVPNLWYFGPLPPLCGGTRSPRAPLRFGTTPVRYYDGLRARFKPFFLTTGRIGRRGGGAPPVRAFKPRIGTQPFSCSSHFCSHTLQAQKSSSHTMCPP